MTKARRAQHALKKNRDPLALSVEFVDCLQQARTEEAAKIARRLLPMLAALQPMQSGTGSSHSVKDIVLSLARSFSFLSRLDDPRIELSIYKNVYRLGDPKTLQSLPVKWIRHDKAFLDELFEQSLLSGTLYVPHRRVKDFCAEHADFYHEFHPRRRVTKPRLRFLDPPGTLTAECGDLTVDPFYLSLIKDATAYSNSNLIWSKNTIVNDALSHRRAPDAICPDTMDGRQILLMTDQRNALIRLPRNRPLHYARGLAMFGVNARVYGHWIVEFMPRMLAYESKFCPDDYPLIVGCDMPPTSLDAIRLMNARKREIITLPNNTVASFGSLGTAPVPAYFPLAIKNGLIYDTVWPTDVYADLRQHIFAALDRARGAPSPKRRRIFISRKNFTARSLVNEQEMTDFLGTKGFEIIYPELLSFAEQVAVFRSADIVVSVCSSAMTNCIFCSPDCRIIGLANDAPDFTFHGFASLWRTATAHSLFVRGDFVAHDASGHRLHRHFRIPLEKMKRALAWAEKDRA